LQTKARKAVSIGLEEYDHRHGYRGAESHVDFGTEASTADWDKVLSPFRPVSGLVPGLVVEIEREFALVYLANGQSIALDLEDMTWASKFISRDRISNQPKSVADIMQVGDIIRTRLHDDGTWKLGQVPEVESALVSIDPKTGAIRALIGGYDFTRSKYNRVMQSKRQPGSSFKPFIYSAALEQGFTTASLVNDAPIVFEDSELERTWKPQNFSEKFYGPTRLREAMVNSRNLVSIRLLNSIGVAYGREYITRFGFSADELPDNLSMALGSASLTPISMARGYSVFANGGFLLDTYFVDSITNDKNETLLKINPPVLCDDCDEPEVQPLAFETASEQNQPAFRPLEVSRDGDTDASQDGDVRSRIEARFEKPRAAKQTISAQNAYLVRSMMMDVVRRGTGVRAMQLGRNDLAGKTGTTNEQRDAWFSGYNDHLVTSVWVGFDNHEPLGRRELGGRAALPIWVSYTGEALKGIEDTPPVMPRGLAQARIDPETGLLARLNNQDAVMEVFQQGNLPEMESGTQGGTDHEQIEEDPYEIY
jgi:penicillin-binding protein 1A